jgi:hypothetical protein
MQSIMHPNMPLLGDTVVVVSPEHYDTFTNKHGGDGASGGLNNGGLDKDGLREEIMRRTRTKVRDLLQTDQCGGASAAMFRALALRARGVAAASTAAVGTSPGSGSASADGGISSVDTTEVVLTEEELEMSFPKFSHKNKLHIVVAGGNAGKFSVYMSGWASGQAGSQPVSKKIEDPPPTASSL